MAVKDLTIYEAEKQTGESPAATGPQVQTSEISHIRASQIPAPQAQASTVKKVGFVSLCCPKNLVDSEVMMGLLARSGAELTKRAEDADVIVVNTCSFIGSAQQESVNTILEMAEHKAS